LVLALVSWDGNAVLRGGVPVLLELITNKEVEVSRPGTWAFGSVHVVIAVMIERRVPIKVPNGSRDKRPW